MVSPSWSPSKKRFGSGELPRFGSGSGIRDVYNSTFAYPHAINSSPLLGAPSVSGRAQGRLLSLGMEALVTFLIVLLATTATTTVNARSTSPSHLLSPNFFSSNYRQMLAQLKIFIYPQISSHSSLDFRSLAMLDPVADLEEQQLNGEQLFFQMLSGSSFVTTDAEEADLFFLPISLTAMARNHSVSVSRNIMMYVQQLRDRYPYWQRALGADHLLVSCQGIKEDFARNVLELRKNAILLACSNLFLDGGGANFGFYPHKDLAMPPHKSWLNASLSSIRQEKRSYLAFLLNPRDSSPAVSSACKLWREDPSFVLDSLNLDSAAYLEILASSKFCLAFGTIGEKISIVDGMRLGCVPVIISSGQLHGVPFQDVLNWHEFSIVVSAKELTKIKGLLTALPEAKYLEMQQAAKAASSHLEWHIPPEPYDTFHMLLYELWIRRHVIRYASRNQQ